MKNGSLINLVLFTILIAPTMAYDDEIIINVTVEVISELKQSCNVSIGLTTDKDIYENNERIIFQNTLSNKLLNFTIGYWIEDLFDNIVKKKIKTSNLKKKSYTPKIKKEQEVFVIKNKLFLNCNNKGQNESEKIIVVKNPYFIEEIVEDEPSTSLKNSASSKKKTTEKKQESPNVFLDKQSTKPVQQGVTGNTIYESKNELNKKKVSILIIATFVVLLVVLILKKSF